MQEADRPHRRSQTNTTQCGSDNSLLHSLVRVLSTIKLVRHTLRNDTAYEIVSHGEAGFLTLPGDVTMLAQYLRQIDQERERLLEMSLAAYRRMSTHPTWDQSFERVRDFLQSLVRNSWDTH